MKKLLIFIIVGICVTVGGCNNKTSIDDNSVSLAEQTQKPSIKPNKQENIIPTRTISAEIKSTPTPSSISKDIKLLDISDFIVSDTYNSIKLDSLFKDFKINKQEEKIDNNYVGETTSGEYVYKTYMHKYTDFDLYVSNLNYNLKKRNFDEYYITQITLKNSNFKTARGIAIGYKLEDVYNSYGRGEKSTVGGGYLLNYKLNDMELSFTIDENQTVQEIVLMVMAEYSP